eukprot:2371649-Prymnesium_polylepis.1
MVVLAGLATPPCQQAPFVADFSNPAVELEWRNASGEVESGVSAPAGVLGQDRALRWKHLGHSEGQDFDLLVTIGGRNRSNFDTVETGWWPTQR